MIKILRNKNKQDIKTCKECKNVITDSKGHTKDCVCAKPVAKTTKTVKTVKATK